MQRSLKKNSLSGSCGPLREFEVTDLQHEAVLFGELLLHTRAQAELLLLVVQPGAVLGPIERVHCEAGLVRGAIHGRVLRPVAAAQVIRAGEEPERIAGEETRVFLLGNGLGQVAGADGREKVGQQ